MLGALLWSDFCWLCIVWHSVREFFIHLENSSLPVKGCKFWTYMYVRCIRPLTNE
jgi:hypothetical protein